MKIPLSWLKEYVDFNLSPGELAEKLTFSGSEVTAVEVVGSDCTGLVAGEILDIRPHSEAERLRVCRVSDGRDDRSVVCGADNFGVGDKAAFAPPGTTLPGGLVIETYDIKGEKSEGMLCAEDEIGLSDDHSGIMLLPSDTAPGTPLADVLGPPETVLHLDITWNRGDCLSIVGIAREVAALCGGRLKPPPVDYVESGEPIEHLTQVAIDDPAGCPRYTARVLSEVKIGPSPLWMRRRLSLCGVRPINNIVDITNYVMLELGQPLHAFDYELLEERRIVVRRARPGESMATLDEIEREISPDMLMIADGKRPVAVAGVMGGAGSEIRDVTRTVLLESAYFDPASIRRTSSALGLATESSHRFERGIDIEGVDTASRRAARLMVELAGAAAARGAVDVYPRPRVQHRIVCRMARVRSLLGMEIPDGEIVRLLESLELPVVERGGETCAVEPPGFRPDLCIEADLIEEVARLHGLDRVPQAIPAARINPEADDTGTRAVSACRAALAGLGLTEIVNYSFVSSELLDRFGCDPAEERIVLPNPVSAEHAVMRDSLAPQMVETLARNLARQVDSAAFFELGRVFRSDAKEEGHVEKEMLCIGMMGGIGNIGRRSPDEEEMFLWIKGAVEQFLRAEHAADTRFAPRDVPCLEPERGLSVSIGGRCIGWLGLLKREIGREWRMEDPVGLCELEIEPVLDTVFAAPELRPLAAYPGVRRDVALIADKHVRHEDVIATMRKVAPPELTSIELFDIFEGKGVGEGRKSMAYSLLYRSLDRTMTDEEVNIHHSVISDALKSELNAEIRER